MKNISRISLNFSASAEVETITPFKEYYDEIVDNQTKVFKF